MIFPGMSHRSAEFVLATALRSFVDDLLRKCIANKMKSSNNGRYVGVPCVSIGRKS